MPDIVDILGKFLADQIVGLDGRSLVFTDRVSHIFPDHGFLQSNITKNAPYLSIPIAAGNYKTSYLLVGKTNIQTVSDITHTGSSPAAASLSGSHRGNHKWILRIDSGGPLGAAAYSLSSDGGATWNNSAITPANGAIDMGDGTVVTLGSEGPLVTGDTYSWETVSLQEREYQTDDITLRLALNFYAANEIEVFGDADFTGYFDQAIDIIKENRAITDGEHIWKLSLDAETQPISDQRADKHRVVIAVILEGSLYYKKRVPLIGSFKEQVMNN